ncbi:MAG: hypothetical protein KAR54_02390 [Candidatus Pacebacteria bacterium]|nr:hypothetical protein [Candidatus Paceibacterota bacterium]
MEKSTKTKNTKILVFTFRTFPWTDDLIMEFGSLQIFGKLKESIDIFCESILKTKPNLIIGVAKSEKDYSTFEKYTVNKFNNGIIEKGGKNKFELDTPKKYSDKFKIRKEPTKSFCNYGMYKIKSFLNKNDLNIPFVFVHILQEDIKELKN